jgi:hypothetical protein
MTKINHICRWKVVIYMHELEQIPGETPGAVSEFRVKGVCEICKAEITQEELENRANLGEREYMRERAHALRGW